jgi:hypothetical protein
MEPLTTVDRMTTSLMDPAPGEDLEIDEQDAAELQVRRRLLELAKSESSGQGSTRRRTVLEILEDYAQRDEIFMASWPADEAEYLRRRVNAVMRSEQVLAAMRREDGSRADQTKEVGCPEEALVQNEAMTAGNDMTTKRVAVGDSRALNEDLADHSHAASANASRRRPVRLALVAAIACLTGLGLGYWADLTRSPAAEVVVNVTRDHTRSERRPEHAATEGHSAVVDKAQVEIGTLCGELLDFGSDNWPKDPFPLCQRDADTNRVIEFIVKHRTRLQTSFAERLEGLAANGTFDLVLKDRFGDRPKERVDGEGLRANADLDDQVVQSVAHLYLVHQLLNRVHEDASDSRQNLLSRSRERLWDALERDRRAHSPAMVVRDRLAGLKPVI